jgi:hypothetical protein
VPIMGSLCRASHAGSSPRASLSIGKQASARTWARLQLVVQPGCDGANGRAIEITRGRKRSARAARIPLPWAGSSRRVADPLLLRTNERRLAAGVARARISTDVRRAGCHSRGCCLVLWGESEPRSRSLMMKVFVAGATGAIGKQLVPRLVAAGHEVHGMTRSDSSRRGTDECRCRRRSPPAESSRADGASR